MAWAPPMTAQLPTLPGAPSPALLPHGHDTGLHGHHPRLPMMLMATECCGHCPPLPTGWRLTAARPGQRAARQRGGRGGAGGL